MSCSVEFSMIFYNVLEARSHIDDCVCNLFQTLDDHSHMVFVQTNIHEILELLVEPGNRKNEHKG